MTAGRIAVAGAGSIGCFVGGALAAQGHAVGFLARAATVAACRRDGLHLTDYAGRTVRLDATRLSDTPAGILAGAALVLVCVKSADTAEMARHIAAHAPRAQVISLQNGVGKVPVLRAALPEADVRGGMVRFNVVATGPARYHRATSGDILVGSGARAVLVDDGPAPVGAPDDAPLVHWRCVDNIEAVQWGKLLINLANAVNALSDLPLLTQLHDRLWRRVIADQMAKGLRVLRAAGIRPARTTAAPPHLIPHLMSLPTWLFRRIAAQMLTIDAEARASMWKDLNRGRSTEIEALQGAILTLAAAHGVAAPLNARLRALIRDAEAAGKGPPGLTPTDITRGLR